MRRLIEGGSSGSAGGTSPLGLGAAFSLRQPGKASPADARSHNRALVLQTLYLKGSQSRAAIARSTGLTKVTVSDLIASLIEEGLVEELGTDGKQRTGKPAMLVDLARTSFNLITADLSGHDSFRAALLDLNTDRVASLEVDRGDSQGEDAVRLAVQLIQDLIGVARQPILGIGIGSPGIVDQQGTVHTAPNLGWENVPLADIVTAKTGISTLVVNDANAATLAEFAFGDDPEDLIFVSIGHGIGAGLIVSGRLVLGSRSAAGEIGQVMVGTDEGLDAEYSRDQILEHWVSVPSMQRAMAGLDEEGANRVLTEAGERLGITLVPVIGALNLNKVIIGGPGDTLGSALVEATSETIRRRTMPDLHEELDVRSSSLGPDNVLYGCAAMTLAEVLGAG